LIDKLQLPFTDFYPLPEIPDELCHIYDLTKFQALAVLASKGIPALHIDHDAYLRKPLPERILKAASVAEFLYEPKKFVYELNRRLPVPRLEVIGMGCAGGIVGGCDLEAFTAIAAASLDIASNPKNRAMLKATNGYQAAVLFGEVSQGSNLAERTEVLLPRGNGYAEDYRKAGYMHLAGLKADRGALAQMAIQTQLDFPEAYLATAKLFDSI
jgi:hypothetical protein